MERTAHFLPQKTLLAGQGTPNNCEPEKCILCKANPKPMAPPLLSKTSLYPLQLTRKMIFWGLCLNALCHLKCILRGCWPLYQACLCGNHSPDWLQALQTDASNAQAMHTHEKHPAEGKEHLVLAWRASPRGQQDSTELLTHEHSVHGFYMRT